MRHLAARGRTQIAAQVGIAQLALDVPRMPGLAVILRAGRAARSAASRAAPRPRICRGRRDPCPPGRTRRRRRPAWQDSRPRLAPANWSPRRWRRSPCGKGFCKGAAQVQHVARCGPCAVNGSFCQVPFALKLKGIGGRCSCGRRCTRRRGSSVRAGALERTVDREVGLDVGAMSGVDEMDAALRRPRARRCPECCSGRTVSRPNAQLRRPSGFDLQGQVAAGATPPAAARCGARSSGSSSMSISALFGLDQLRVFRPFGIGELYAVGQDARDASQLDIELAGDFEVTAGVVADVAIQRSAQHSPMERNATSTSTTASSATPASTLTHSGCLRGLPMFAVSSMPSDQRPRRANAVSIQGRAKSSAWFRACSVGALLRARSPPRRRRRCYPSATTPAAMRRAEKNHRRLNQQFHRDHPAPLPGLCVARV